MLIHEIVFYHCIKYVNNNNNNNNNDNNNVLFSFKVLLMDIQ